MNEPMVMVVEDDLDVREAIIEVLEDNEFRCVAASNGAEALDTLRRAPERPCVILLDVMMPIMDGWQFRSAQRQDPHLASIPVVVLSANANIEKVTTGMQADSSLKKPVDIDHLLSTVGKYCRN